MLLGPSPCPGRAHGPSSEVFPCSPRPARVWRQLQIQQHMWRTPFIPEQKGPCFQLSLPASQNMQCRDCFGAMWGVLIFQSLGGVFLSGIHFKPTHLQNVFMIELLKIHTRRSTSPVTQRWRYSFIHARLYFKPNEVWFSPSCFICLFKHGAFALCEGNGVFQTLAMHQYMASI